MALLLPHVRPCYRGFSATGGSTSRTTIDSPPSSCSSRSFLLYLIYYPLSHKYVQSVPIASSALPTSHRRSMVRSLVPKFMRTTTPHGLIRPSLSSSTIASDLSSDDDYTDSDRDGLLDRTGGGGGGGRFGGFHPANFILPGQLRRGEIILSSEYRHAVSLFFLTVLHFTLTFLTTAILITTLPTTESPHPGNPTPTPPWEPLPGQPGSGKEHASERAVRVWATTVGLMSVVLACVQYTPQLVHTYQRKLVGSLSIPMMLIQVRFPFLRLFSTCSLSLLFLTSCAIDLSRPPARSCLCTRSRSAPTLT